VNPEVAGPFTAGYAEVGSTLYRGATDVVYEGDT